MSVLIETSLGDIVIDVFTQEAPKAALNFLKLCKVKYYNLCKFRIQKNLLIQTGDPTHSGKGGDSIFKLLSGRDEDRFFETEKSSKLRHVLPGTVSMASAGLHKNASQFFITTRGDLDFLDDKYTIFGEVAEGMDVVMRISEQFLDEERQQQSSAALAYPLQDVLVRHTIVLDENDVPDPPGLEALIPDSSPLPTVEDLQRISEQTHTLAEGEIEKVREVESKMTEEQRNEQLARVEARSHAEVLTMVGDLPEPDVKPPDNVLFVCKLNPVTQAEDLELIFSQFGEIESAEVIRDPMSGDSLCYAFVEFVDASSCEAAYFKMDNVLVDERRIRVDFSQSVAKLKGFGALQNPGGWKEFRKLGVALSGKELNVRIDTPRDMKRDTDSKRRKGDSHSHGSGRRHGNRQDRSRHHEHRSKGDDSPSIVDAKGLHFRGERDSSSTRPGGRMARERSERTDLGDMVFDADEILSKHRTHERVLREEERQQKLRLLREEAEIQDEENEFYERRRRRKYDDRRGSEARKSSPRRHFAGDDHSRRQRSLDDRCGQDRHASHEDFRKRRRK